MIVKLLHILLQFGSKSSWFCFCLHFSLFSMSYFSCFFIAFCVFFLRPVQCCGLENFSCLFFSLLFMSLFYDRDNVVALKTFHVLWAGAIFLLHQRKWPLKESGGKMVLRDWHGSAGLLYTWSLGEPSGLPFPVGVLSSFGTEAIMAWPCDPRPNPFEKQVSIY